MKRNVKSRYSKRNTLRRVLEHLSARGPNRFPVIKHIRKIHAIKSYYKRRLKGGALRVATLGYVKPLSHKKLKPCKGVRKNIRKAYFAFKTARNWRRGGNRAKDFRSKKVAKSRFTVLNCK